MSQTCHYLKDKLYHNEEIWKQLYQRDIKSNILSYKDQYINTTKYYNSILCNIMKLERAGTEGCDIIIKNSLKNIRVGIECEMGIKEAAKNGHYNSVNAFLNNDKVTFDKNKALIKAAKNGHVDIVELLLNNGADIHYNYDKALSVSFENGRIEVVKLLLNRGADIRCISENAFSLAVDTGYNEILNLFNEVISNFHNLNAYRTDSYHPI